MRPKVNLGVKSVDCRGSVKGKGETTEDKIIKELSGPLGKSKISGLGESKMVCSGARCSQRPRVQKISHKTLILIPNFCISEWVESLPGVTVK